MFIAQGCRQGPRCEENWMSIIIVRACFISTPAISPHPPLPLPSPILGTRILKNRGASIEKRKLMVKKNQYSE